MKPNVNKMLKTAKIFTKKHSPEILTGIGIAGMITTTVMSVKATPKALQIIEEEKQKRNTLTLRKTEVVKATWKCYAPAAITGVASIGCLIGGTTIGVRRNAALVTAYNLSRTALNDYKEKVVETIGEEQEQIIREKVAQDKIKKAPEEVTEVIMNDATQSLCYDSFGGRYFTSNLNTIEKAINELNKRMLLEDYITLNDFYNELGLHGTELGDNFGWGLGREGYLKLCNPSSMISEDGRPCIMVAFEVEPVSEYNVLFR